jgi:hypothetical protein
MAATVENVDAEDQVMMTSRKRLVIREKSAMSSNGSSRFHHLARPNGSGDVAALSTWCGRVSNGSLMLTKDGAV